VVVAQRWVAPRELDLSVRIGRLAPSQLSDGRAAPLDRSSLDFHRSPLSRRLALASPRMVG
jgi:hypothetical protein